MTQSRLVGSRYELGELIGYGGMAEVHKGRDIRLGREVAIKVLRADLARDPSFLNRFRREAQSAAALNHPSIVSVYDTGEDIGGEGTALPYIVMEYVEGRTLRDILKAEGRLPARRAMEIAADVAAALDFSHHAGLVHRDVKPANVMITKTGAVKVMDFGIARAVADSSATVTQTANVIGTAQYLSPEQARGEAVDARSDVYSTGCLLYELVTGIPPFQGDSPVAVAYQHVRENAAAPSSRVAELPRALDSIVMKALAKNPLNRYQTAGEMRTDLQRALADQPVTAESVMTDDERTQFIQRAPLPPVPVGPPPAYHEDEPRRRNAWVWVAVAVAVLLVLGVGGFFIWKVNQGDQQAAPTQLTMPRLVGQTVSQAQQTVAQFNQQHCQPGTAGTCGIELQPNTDQGPSTSGACAGDVSDPQDGQICTLVNSAGRPVNSGDVISVPTPQTQPYVLYYQTFEHATSPVPYLLGDTPDEAAAKLQQAHLAVSYGPQINTFEYDAGHVAKQNPLAGRTVNQGSRVTVRLSTGRVQLPDVTGMDCDAATARLNALWPSAHPSPHGRVTHNRALDGQVYRIEPTPGNLYTADQNIILFCYHYTAPPPPTPTCDSNLPPTSTSPTDTPTESPTESPTGSPTDAPPPTPGATPPTTPPTSPPDTNTLPPCPSS